MTWAWKQDLDPTDKFVLVALSDHANDEDFTCWPSLTHLQKKTGYSRPTVWTAINSLIEVGAIQRVGKSAAGSTRYMVMVGNELTLVNDLNQVSSLTRVGKEINEVGKQLSKVGKEVNPNHKNHHESSINHHDVQTAKFIFGLIQSLSPKHKPPNFDSWANDVRLMRERDHRTDDEIRSLFSWANRHHFWKTNILSPATLRKQWDKLDVQRNNGGTHAPHQRTDNSAIARVRAANGIKR